MEVTITLTICLSLVFVITLGIVSSTLRDKNFKVRFDDRNKRMMRIIAEQRDELISYREAIKKNDANLEKSLEVLASASDVIGTRISRLKDTEELLSMVKVELADLNLGTDKVSKKMDEAIRSFSSHVQEAIHILADGLHKWIIITPRLKLLCRIDEQGNLLPKELDRIKKVKQTLGIK